MVWRGPRSFPQRTRVRSPGRAPWQRKRAARQDKLKQNGGPGTGPGGHFKSSVTGGHFRGEGTGRG